ncbi:cation:proton antiporter [Haloarchaeobius iranensis]|uniref:Potassium/proton antiporter membrane subunit, CPA2 family n=1 Tax=Haloarchaeobius iranensis TaxID=996166 RepID=A0A1G9X4K0_9EURY|nr:cation:proton antiporter [Haloarchaeobius iranensis]SDM91704.1 potassium/proton antiporter membrane subunit, CPA2 family [Haloarchaeobius iranensis]
MASGLLLEAGLAIAVLAVAGTLAYRLGQSVIPAYIVVGLVVGPNAPTVGGVSFAVLQRHEFVDLLAELGVVLLLFFIGVEFSIDQLLANRDRLAVIGGIDLVVNAGVGVAIGLAFGFTPVEVAFVTGIVYISSSAVVTKSLIDLGWVADPEAEVVLGTLVVEDLAIAVYLAVLSALVLGGGGGAALSAVAIALGFIAVLVVLARVGTPVVQRILSVGSDELFVLTTLGAVALVGGLAVQLGVSEAVAAFFVGTAVSATDAVHRVETLLSPARDLFAAIFFLAIGFQTDLGSLSGTALTLLAVAVALTGVSKLVSGYWSGLRYGLSERRARRVGIALVARGEFSLVLAALALEVGTGALADVIPAFAVGYVLAMSVLGTVLMKAAPRLEKYLEADSTAPEGPADGA